MKRTVKALILFFIGFLLVSVSYTENSEAKEANLIFRILTNTQSHSAPPKMTLEQIETMKVLIDSPPPANPNVYPIDTTVIKNHPPPGS